MAIPFCMGKVIDIIYTSAKDGQLRENLNNICKILLGVFLVGAVANFGRVYLISVSGKYMCTCIPSVFSPKLRKDCFKHVKSAYSSKVPVALNHQLCDQEILGFELPLAFSCWRL
jgi:hypothetical protein